MYKNFIFIIALITILHSTAHASNKYKDIAKETGIYLDKEKKIELLELTDSNFLRIYLFGSFADSHSIWGGRSIHLYPNMKFVLIKHAEFRKDEVLYYGGWKYSNGKIILYPKASTSKSSKFVDHNDLRFFYLFLKSNKGVIEDSLIISEGNYKRVLTGSDEFEYFNREVSYYDWEKVFKQTYPLQN